MKKMITFTALTLCAALAFSVTACSGQKTPEQTSSSSAASGTSASTSESVQIPNPWQDCKTIEDAEKLAGFDFQLPETPEGYSLDSISAIEGDIIQVIYHNGEKKICIRKASGVEDASGDYNEYKTIMTKDVEGSTVTLKGNDGNYKLAIWTAEEYAYSVSSSESRSEEEMTQLAESVVLENMLIGGDPATWGPALG